MGVEDWFGFNVAEGEVCLMVRPEPEVGLGVRTGEVCFTG